MNHKFVYQIITCTIMLFTCFTTLVAENPKFEIIWQAWSPEIFAQAKKENKLILLDLGAEWCSWCKKMDTVTYRNQQVVEVINKNYIAVRADVDQHPELAQRYKNYGPPTTVVYNSVGTEIIKRPGYMEAQILYWMLDTVAADPDPAAHR